MVEEGYLEDVKKQRMLLAAVVLAGITTMFNNTTVSIAIPSFMDIFDTEIRIVQWVVVGYMLLLAMAMPLAGYFGHRYGYRKMFVTALTAMGIASLACALAWDLYSLIFFRMAKGAVSGVIVPCTMTLLYRHIPKKKQPHYLGITVMSHSLGVAIGPSIAGMLLEFTSWHILFLINVPLVALAVYFSRQSLPAEGGHKTQALDYLGILTVALGTGLILIGFTNLEIWGVKSIKFLSCFTTGFILILFFVFRESHSLNPLLNFTVLKYKPFAIALLINCVMAMALGITGILVAVYVQTILGYSPMEAGLILVIPSATMVLGNIFSDRFFDRIPSKAMVFSGLLIAALGNYGMSKVGLTTGVITIVIFMSIRYLGMGMVKMPLTDYGLGSVPSSLSGHASSMFNWGKQIVSVITTNILTVLLSINTSRYYAEAGFQGEIVEGTVGYAVSAVQAVNDDFFYLAVFLAGSALLSLLMESTGKRKTSANQKSAVRI
ncbi:MAG: MFS transporter [Clostridia bacterium]|nr:MFS transporter [Clostridia bacterium]